MDKIKLKPCPFCGGEVTLRENSFTSREGERLFYSVRCLTCGARTDFFNGVAQSKKKTINAWNKRALEKNNPSE